MLIFKFSGVPIIFYPRWSKSNGGKLWPQQEVIVKPSKLNVGPYHLFYLELGESSEVVDYQLPNADLFKIKVILD